MSYCSFVNDPDALDSADFRLHKHYHDYHYGFPIAEDDELFGRLLLEINQAGLSWTLMLRRQENFRQAYDGFSIDKVAAYTAQDVERLLNDAGIIRNRLKINAAIFNAQRIVALREDYGSWKGWLDAHHPLTKPEWVKLFKKNFRFTGGEIVGEFLMSTGYLPGAHSADCPIFTKLKTNADRR
ncbi:DNA-3-methyladenine glycosylase I [Arundinibacter roseus]|uniref:DNA-3-methyladenine glycosylase I n=1 Tax=Arundinibacter roseus TaxID=2070510 RepID=A0A4R4KKT0_9BACT|nr:DNA-3-methyladenine glycosylase I [Arundinibacter roseus]TDB68897.1 DNA-3-methyladenine glycosylase I [Arundinibacter roseus]